MNELWGYRKLAHYVSRAPVDLSLRVPVRCPVLVAAHRRNRNTAEVFRRDHRSGPLEFPREDQWIPVSLASRTSGIPAGSIARREQTGSTAWISIACARIGCSASASR